MGLTGGWPQLEPRAYYSHESVIRIDSESAWQLPVNQAGRDGRLHRRQGCLEAKMKIHEYQAKELLSRYGVPVPSGSVASTIILKTVL